MGTDRVKTHAVCWVLASFLIVSSMGAWAAEWEALNGGIDWYPIVEPRLLHFNGDFVLTGVGPNAGLWRSRDGEYWYYLGAAPFAAGLGEETVVFNGKIFLIQGGWDGNNNVWGSSDGVTWEDFGPRPWPDRAFYQTLVFDGKLWVFGGYSLNGNLNDVWYTSDGTNWTQATANADWSPRYSFCAVTDGSLMYVMGGTDNSSPDGNDLFNDVWMSPDGITWILLGEADWSPRSNAGALFVEDGFIVAGGSIYSDGYTISNDVWYSPNAITWTQLTASAPWSPRSGFAMATDGETVMIAGGYDGSDNNETWTTHYGVDWTQKGTTLTPAPWAACVKKFL